MFKQCWACDRKVSTDMLKVHTSKTKKDYVVCKTFDPVINSCFSVEEVERWRNEKEKEKMAKLMSEKEEDNKGSSGSGRGNVDSNDASLVAGYALGSRIGAILQRLDDLEETQRQHVRQIYEQKQQIYEQKQEILILRENIRGIRQDRRVGPY